MKVVWTLAKILLGAALIGALFMLGGLDVSVLATAASRWGYLAAGIVCVASAISLGAVRWHIILGVPGIHPPFADTFRLTCIGTFFNACLPGCLSGDTVKAYYVVRDHTEKKVAEAAATILVDRVIGMAAFMCIASVALAVSARHLLAEPRLRPLVAGIVALFAVVWALIFATLSRRLRARRRRWLGKRGKVGQFLMRLDEAVSVYREERAGAWLGMGISAVGQLLNVLGCYFFGRAMGDGFLPLVEYMYLVPVAMGGNFIAITPMGVGIGESCFEGLFRLRGSEFGAEIQVLWRLGTVPIGLLGLLFYVMRRREYAEAVRAGRAA